jgi:hypothetical protein
MAAACCAAAEQVVSFRADEANLAVAQRLPGCRMRVRLVRDHHLRPGPWTTGPDPGDADPVEQRQQLRVVPGLSRGKQDA